MKPRDIFRLRILGRTLHFYKDKDTGGYYLSFFKS